MPNIMNSSSLYSLLDEMTFNQLHLSFICILDDNHYNSDSPFDPLFEQLSGPLEHIIKASYLGLTLKS
jgi:hypothetical protein